MDPIEFRTVLSHFAAGVTVITTRDAGGQRLGFTATAFSSVSLDPPLVLFCVTAGGRCDAALKAEQGFAVNILGEDQTNLAVQFARRSTNDRFDGVALSSGVEDHPLLRGAIATLTCEHAGRIEAGDHVVHMGHALYGTSTDNRPLLHFRGAFDQLAKLPVEPIPGSDFMVGAAW